MNTYLVATIARYVLVEAKNESEARSFGLLKLHDLYQQDLPQLPIAIRIHTVRLATQEEIDLWTWHCKMVASCG